MDVKSESRREHNPVETRSEEAADIAATLAPLEEQGGRDEGGHHRRKGGAIVVDTARLKLPKGFIEERPQKGFGLEPVVVFILILVLGFIAFIAYLISIEPPK